MLSPEQKEVTRYLERIGAGDSEAVNQLLSQVYEHLHRIAQRAFHDQRGDHTLQPTALVHEVYLRLIGKEDQRYVDSRHFFRVAALAMRQLLTDYARARTREKRGGGCRRVELPEDLPHLTSASFDLLALHSALSDLRELSERQADVVELRFLMGLSNRETADVLGVSERTVRLDWSMARAWLELRLGEDEDG